MTNAVSWTAIDDELLYFVRNNATDPKGRVMSQTDEFNGDGSTVAFTLTKSPVFNITAVTVNGTSKSYGDDYSVSIDTDSTIATITFTTAPPVGTDNVDITYHYQRTWIYPDLPLKTLKLDSYPRIGITNVSSPMIQLGVGTGATQTSMLKDIVVYGRSENEVNTIINELKNAFINNKDQFYSFNYIQPVGVGPMTKEEGRHEKIINRTLSVEIPFIVEW